MLFVLKILNLVLHVELTDLHSKPKAIQLAAIKFLHRVFGNKKLIGAWEHMHR
jgi:hypothetical protein